MIIKCKMCGGDLSIQEGNPICECEFCGSMQTVPLADSEKKINLFNRANHLRMNAEFDKAAVVYESIVAEFPSEAEAYWGLCLCTYGIEYVDDPASGEKKPTCHRTLPVSIMEDTNFEQACDYADGVARRAYREEAKAIDRIQQDILQIVANEDPYDVFICYKETAEEGGRTEDSVLAQDIYDALTEKGLKVFFSRITLEDKLGQQYEPYIYAALSSAKVMLAVGTKYEYYDAVWVKNEWMRFLSMMKTDKSKALIPCYKDLDAYDMPKEFKNLQAQDMNKLGWLQDLTRGVIKLCGKEGGSSSTGKEGTIKNIDPALDSLLKKAYRYLEEEKWQNAEKYLELSLDMDPANPMAFIGKMLEEANLRRVEEIDQSYESFANNVYYQKAIQYAQNRLEYKDFIEKVKRKNEENENRLSFIDALKTGNVLKAKELLQNGLNPNAKCSLSNAEDTNILLSSILFTPNTDIAQMLIEAGADVNFAGRHDNDCIPVLNGAIITGNVSIVKKLLEKGANPNSIRTADNLKSSALADAIIYFPNDAISNMLLDAGADINYVTESGEVALPILICAIMAKNTGIVKKLLEKGADPNCGRIIPQYDMRTSALLDSITLWPNNEIAEMLINAGADVNYICKDQFGASKPIIYYAVDASNIKIVKMLLERGANPNSEIIYKDNTISSILTESIMLSKDAISMHLIDAGANVNYFNLIGGVYKKPVLAYAIETGNAKMVKLLLDKGADSNSEREIWKDQRSSLLRDSIITHPNEAIARALLAAGANGNYSSITSSGKRETILHEVICSTSLPYSNNTREKAKYIDILMDAGASFANESDEVKKVKFADKGNIPTETQKKMKLAGWHPSFF